MSSKYREMMKIKMEKEKIAAKRSLLATEVENLLNRPVEDQPLDDMNLERSLLNLVGRNIVISAEKTVTSGRVENVIGSGYKMAFEIDGELYPLFSANGNTIYDITDHSTQTSVYANEHLTDSLVEQIAFSLGMRYAREYVYDVERDLLEQEDNLERQESANIINSLGHNEGK